MIEKLAKWLHMNTIGTVGPQTGGAVDSSYTWDELPIHRKELYMEKATELWICMGES